MRHRPALGKLWFYEGKDKNVQKFNANGCEVPPERACGPEQRKERLRLLDDVMKELDVSWELWNPHPLTHQTLTRRLGWSVMHGMERASGGLGAGHEG